MPHLMIDHSPGLAAKADIPGLCRALHGAILATGLFEVGAVRVRAFTADFAIIADDHPQNGYLDMQFRIGAGRSAEEKKRAGEAIFAAATSHLADLFSSPHFALSLEIREIDPVLSWKKNAIHPRLRMIEEA